MTASNASDSRASDHVSASRRPATILVTTAVAAVAVLLLLAGTRAYLRMAGVLSIDMSDDARRRAGQMGLFTIEERRTAEGLTAVLALGACLLCVVLAIGLLRLRSWAREGVMGVFGLGGVAVALLSLAGLGRDAANAMEGLVAGVVMLGVGALALAPSCARDVGRNEVLRARRREAAYQQRRARRADE